MPSVKQVSDHYFITAPEVTITGNLTVAGTQASISSTDSVITDRIIVLNDGEASAGITGQQKAGIEVDRGSLPNASLVFDETDDKFKVTTDAGASWSDILLASNGLQAVVDDLTPELGGNLSIAGFSIVNVPANVTLTFATVGAGGSGVYVTNDTATNEELATKRTAFIYSLIF